METRDTGPKRDDSSYRIYDARSMGRALRHFRQEAGLTQAELAERTGVSRQYLVEMEQGLETEQLRRLLRVLKTLGVRITLGRQDW
jgi:HTH-type transcriptional regulator / antitoxin HipB